MSVTVTLDEVVPSAGIVGVPTTTVELVTDAAGLKVMDGEAARDKPAVWFKAVRAEVPGVEERIVKTARPDPSVTTVAGEMLSAPPRLELRDTVLPP